MKNLKFTVCTVKVGRDKNEEKTLYVKRRLATFANEKDAAEYATKKRAQVFESCQIGEKGIIYPQIGYMWNLDAIED